MSYKSPIFGIAHPKVGIPFTYTFHNNHLYVKIDHILYRGDMKVLSCRRDKKGESDHYPLVAVFER